MIKDGSEFRFWEDVWCTEDPAVCEFSLSFCFDWFKGGLSG